MYTILIKLCEAIMFGSDIKIADTREEVLLINPNAREEVIASYLKQAIKTQKVLKSFNEIHDLSTLSNRLKKTSEIFAQYDTALWLLRMNKTREECSPELLESLKRTTSKTAQEVPSIAQAAKSSLDENKGRNTEERINLAMEALSVQSSAHMQKAEARQSQKTAKINKDHCSQCKKTGAELNTILQKCARCRTVLYCSKECQRTDWPKHKEVCRVLAAAPAKAHPAAAASDVD
jgi:predicted DNA-binding protein YlxM (UPF0122 family)